MVKETNRFGELLWINFQISRIFHIFSGDSTTAQTFQIFGAKSCFVPCTSVNRSKSISNWESGFLLLRRLLSIDQILLFFQLRRLTEKRKNWSSMCWCNLGIHQCFTICVSQIFCYCLMQKKSSSFTLLCDRPPKTSKYSHIQIKRNWFLCRQCPVHICCFDFLKISAEKCCWNLF
jgi:hypothetical protein